LSAAIAFAFRFALILTAQLALTSGTRLGVYDISAPIGEGGMGQVYRATDTTLGRQVAIKILPDAFAGDAERLARFEREAKTLASLNHPHIAAIYGFEKSAGVYALVMELVEGEDLSQRIGESAIAIDEALPIARQIAEALEAAHEQGVVHRDLKPANIKLRADGTVKVLDFGLARPATTGGTGADALNSPTFTSPAALTMGGMILGTAAYMAPEQARGKTVDKRADIWAFGLVLYEMLVGRTAFAGDTISDLLAAVLTREPDWTALPATTPASIRRLLARCLEKDPKRRLRDIGDARLEIEETIRSPTADSSPLAASPRLPPFAWATAAFAAAAIVIVGLAASGVWPRARTSEARPLRLSIVHTEGSEVGAPAISPDGRPSGRSRGQRQPRELSAALLVRHGTEPGGQPRRGRGGSRTAGRYVRPVAGGPDQGHRQTADDDSRVRRLPRLVPRRQAHGLCVSTYGWNG
jgi:serine/threonine protein kinase